MEKNPGKIFEEDFKKSAMAEDIWILRLNDTSLSWLKEKTARFTPKNICDFLVYQYPYLYPVECKSTGGTSISIQRSEEDNNAMIKVHQIEGLQKANLIKGIYPMLMLNYRDDSDINNNVVYALPIDNFTKFLNDSNKMSINKKDCEQYKGIVVKQQLQRKHFIYDINQILEEVVNNTKK